MIARFLLAVGLAVVMVVTGVTSYVYIGSRQTKVAAPIQKPPTATPKPEAFSLPGTLYLAQSGALYSFSAGRFHQLTAEEGWTQPALFPDGSALVDTTVRDLASGGKSHSKVIPTTWSPAPNANRISVVEGSSDTMRTRRS